jgi:hypothetical protein
MTKIRKIHLESRAMTKPSTRISAACRRGKVVILVAFMLPTVLIPILAIGVDGGLLMEDRRRLQAASDAAALAAAAQLYRENPDFISNNSNTSHPPNTAQAHAAALDTLNEHGFESAVCEVRTVSIPASSANPRINGMPGTIEVNVTFLQPRGFSGLWGSDALKVAARAVARVRNYSQGNGIILLEDTDDRALYGRGGGTLLVNQGGAVDNSTGSQAALTDGTGTVLAAKSFDVTGGAVGGGFYETPYPAAGLAEPYTGSVPVPDPLRDLPEPSSLEYPVQIAPPNSGPSGSTITLQPGRYTTRLFYDGPRTIALEPGIYYLEQGIGLQGQVQLTGSGVMIYNAGSGGNNINLGGQGTWTISPPTSGPYAGVGIFQSRNTADQNTTNILRGNGGAGVTGAIYCPTTEVRLTGNGTQVLGSQFIARTLEMDGNGHFTVNFAAPKAPQPPILELVE